MTLRSRLRAALESASPRRLDIPEFTSAAVLVPIVERGEAVSLVFTVRPDDMPTHGGQISFPGGRRERRDDSSNHTALREAHEELGIPRRAVAVLGSLDDVASPVGFVVRPVVGWLTDPPALRPDPREVEEVFEVGLDVLSDPSNFRWAGEHDVDGHTYPLPEFHVGERRIWGVTARIVQQLLEILGLPAPGPA